jgi:signal transduction histidine kinase
LDAGCRRAERLQLVFDKEETDPNKEAGLGLGLAIVKTFVEAHDGVVDLREQVGYRFDIPVYTPCET